MKFITWLLIFCFTSQVMAGSIREGLQTAMNDYEYEMVVEWDQKDVKQAQLISKKFTERLEALYAQGLSNDEVMKYIESRVTGKKQLQAIQASAALQAKGGSSAENMARALQENMQNFGSQGASWTGGLAYAAVISGIVILASLIVYQLVWNLNHRCVRAETREECSTTEECDSWSYDSDGYEYCDGWTSYTSCSDVEHCLAYERKP